jgi:N-dimethylarginine dimethylaminohydrolase
MKKTGSELLMCFPEHYAIRYVINPWMKLTRQIIHDKAQFQWKRLYEILSNLNCKIHLIKQVAGLPDMVFTANAGLPVDRKVFLSRFRHTEREAEANYFKKWFRRNGFQLISLPSGIYFEGAGDALFVGNTLFAGYRFRSDIRAHTFIAETLGVEVLSLELTKRQFYHLDTCFTPLSSRSILYYPSAFDRYGQKVIEKNIADPIAVSKNDALKFVCNAVVIGQDIVIHQGCTETCQLLSDRGYRIHETNLSEFIKAGGSTKCLTLTI